MIGVTVLGGGVIGLASALVFQRSGQFQVTLISHEFNTASMVSQSAVSWWIADTDHGTGQEREKHWAERSFEVMLDQTSTSDSGVKLVAGVKAYKEDAGSDDPWFGRFVPNFRRVKPGEGDGILPPGFVDGYAFDSIFIDSPKHLDWLLAQARHAGVTVRGTGDAPLSSLAEAREITKDSLIINCTGLGSKYLTDVHDDKMYGVRGQTVLVRAPGVTRWIACGNGRGHTELCHVFPSRADGVVVCGGNRRYNDESTDHRPEDEQTILARCQEIVPELKSAEVVGHTVGVRPFREGGVRLEIESRPEYSVLHNYGHGDIGYILAWGCAEDALAMATSAL